MDIVYIFVTMIHYVYIFLWAQIDPILKQTQIACHITLPRRPILFVFLKSEVECPSSGIPESV